MSNEEIVTPEQLREKVERASQMKVSGDVFPAIQLVEIRSRGKFDLREHVTYLNFDSLEGLYSIVLQTRIAARAVASSGNPALGGNPRPDSKPA